MTTPPPEPHTSAGFLAHIRQFFEQDVQPEIADARIKAENALAYIKAHAAQEQAIASLLVKIVSAADPAAAPVLAALLPEAEAVLAKAEQWVADLAGTGM
jgi:hypothetical protein